MAQPPDRRDSEAGEIEREMKMIEREGGGFGESTPFRRLVVFGAIAAVVVLALWYLVR